MNSALKHSLKKGQATANHCRFLSHASCLHRLLPTLHQAPPFTKEVLLTTSFDLIPVRALGGEQGRNAAPLQEEKTEWKCHKNRHFVLSWPALYPQHLKLYLAQSRCSESVF